MAGEGIDTVKSSVTCSLASEVENLTPTGFATIDGTGNDLDNTITGNAAANVLYGGAGADTMAGGSGHDTYIIDDAGDATLEDPRHGTDTVLSPLTWTLAANIENLTLTGTSAVDGTGNALNNVLWVPTLLLEGGFGHHWPPDE